MTFKVEEVDAKADGKQQKSAEEIPWAHHKSRKEIYSKETCKKKKPSYANLFESI